MQAIEFETRIENGRIVIPEQYQQTFGDSLQVRVILLKSEPVGEQQDDFIAELLEHPLEINNFMPQTRGELYDRMDFEQASVEPTR
jgi:hypothetical protein